MVSNIELLSDFTENAPLDILVIFSERIRQIKELNCWRITGVRRFLSGILPGENSLKFIQINFEYYGIGSDSHDQSSIANSVLREMFGSDLTWFQIEGARYGDQTIFGQSPKFHIVIKDIDNSDCWKRIK